MKRLPLLILMMATGIFVAVSTMGTGTHRADPPTKYDEILHLVGKMLSEAHYSPQAIDDAFAKKVFDKFIKELDPERNFFLQSDIDQLRKYETLIDDEINGAPAAFFLSAGRLFHKRMEESALLATEWLSKPFDFTVNETVEQDGDKLKAPASLNDRKERWRKKMKYLTLERFADLLENQEKNKGKEGFVMKSEAELEQEARDKVKRLMDRTFDRYKHKFTDEDKFNQFVNSITTTMDPHTEFFPPVDKRYFDEEMSGRFFGIGASLQYDEGSIKITSVVTGSPAWKSGMIGPGDVIVKVGQGNEEPVDLTGYVVTDAVKIIRGKKGTEVRLHIRKQDGTIKVVSLIRDEIVQDETFARSAIVRNESGRIGYIFLPEFYADFDRPNGNRCFIDVAKEVNKLKEEKVDGIVIDLRNNGGGSLYDVVQMVGLFIEEGPIVQVKDRENKPSLLRDKDRNVLYSGPLAVMVNEFSASASEIFAAAIQDYNRGVIIGSTSTYGKGTVQRNIGLDPETGFSMSNSDLGTVKLTLQKFYRINGGSTQLRGVQPDIILPDNMEFLNVREKDDPDALPWDEIPRASFTPWNATFDIKSLQQKVQVRNRSDNTFQLIRDNTEWLSKRNDKQITLNLAAYRAEQKDMRNTVRQLETLLKLKGELDVSALPKDANRWQDDKAKQERFMQWLKGLQKDIYLDQAVKIMADMIGQQNLAKRSQASSPSRKSN
ncbi:MAG: hypothetical protein RJA57_2018 [Bacteroidota bacterium]